MRVTNEMINKELRPLGILIRTMIHAPSYEKFSEAQKKPRSRVERSMIGRDIEGLRCGTEQVPRKNGSGTIRTRTYRPLHQNKKLPGVIWIHGGGYSGGHPEQSHGMFRNLTKTKDCVIVAPDYRRSGEAPYPAALEDCYDTLLWMRDHAEELGIRADQLMVGGESAGGGLCAALTLYARDRGEVAIAFQMPLYPMIDDRMITESAKDNDAPLWNSAFNANAWRLYLGEFWCGDVPAYAAPARATDFRGLPPTATFVGDIEPFRDETIAYVEALKEVGVPVDFELYPGCYHAFDMVRPKSSVSKKATTFLMQAFAHAVDHYFAEQSE